MKKTFKVKKRSWIKKIILIMLMIIMGFVISKNFDKFYLDKVYKETNRMAKDENGEKRDPIEIPLDGTQEVRQDFIAKEDGLITVNIDFKAWEQNNGTGDILVEILDKNGNLLIQKKKAVSQLVQAKKNITTKFITEIDLSKNETYTLVIKSDQVVSKKGVYLYAVDEKGALFGDLTVNGKKTDGRIQASFIMKSYASESIYKMYMVLFIGIIFIIIPFDKMKVQLHNKTKMIVDINKWMSRLFFVGSVPLSFFIVQRYAGYGIHEFIDLSRSFKGYLNYFLYFLIFLIIYIVCNRTKYTAIIMVLFSSMLGLINYFVWLFRGTPIMAADIASVGTAMDVAENYVYELDFSSLWALVYTVTFVCMALSLADYRGLKWKQRICVLLISVIPFGYYYTQILHGRVIKDHNITVSVWNPQRNYAQNGLLLSFFLSYTYYVVDKPDGYSVENVLKIAEKYTSDSREDNSENRPNVIAIMNEAFSDLKVDADIETSEDYMPFIHGLTENTVKGNLYVSIFGGNTADTEFEFLTGCSMAFLPFRSIPYNTYIKDTFPSITYNLKDEGYVGNIAIHPGYETSWNRNVIYPYLGFDNFYTKKDMADAVYVRNYISDQSDFEFLISKYEETRMITDKPFFVFNVTIQNHGGYSITQGLVDTDITVTNDDFKSKEAEQYLNLIKKTDDSFKYLVDYFEKVEEPTVIIMFGDHQPSLKSSYYEKLFGKKLKDFSVEDIIRKYTVPYIIWANYDIEEKEADLSSNYLSAYLMKTIGLNMSGYQKYLMDLYEKLPVIIASVYKGDDGTIHRIKEKSEYSDLIQEYKIIQYNNIFDTKNRVDSFYQLAQ